MYNFLFEMGFTNITDGWAVIMSFVGFVILLMYVSAFVTGFKPTIPLNKQFYMNLAWEPWSAAAQQFGMFFLLFILKLVFPDFLWFPEMIAILFAYFHFPNWFLMFPAGFLLLAISHHMEVYHNIYATITAHALIASIYQRITPKAISNCFSPLNTYIKAQKEINKKMEDK